MDFVLVHSPLVGPSTWRWLAQELEAAGHRASMPAVPAAVAGRGWAAFADSVAAHTAGGEVLVGHSGAGPLLPQIAERSGRPPSGLVFVDAALPPQAGPVELMPAEMLAELQALASDGVLPPWSDWFGPGVMQELIPDDARRAVISAELPTLPLAYFEEPVPVPHGWAGVPGGYVLLSDAYAAAADEAAARGWPVARQLGGHLDIVTRPEEVASAIESVASRM